MDFKVPRDIVHTMPACFEEKTQQIIGRWSNIAKRHGRLKVEWCSGLLLFAYTREHGGLLVRSRVCSTFFVNRALALLLLTKVSHACGCMITST